MITPPGAELRPIGQLRPGTVLYQGRFRIDLLLTTSPTQALYRAWDLIQQRVVTLLECSTPSYQAAKTALERAAPLLEYDHSVITAIQVIFVERETLFFMLALGGGQTIAQIMEGRAAPVRPAGAIRWVVQAADGVVFLTSHLPEWVMGDLSAGSLLVTAEDRVQLLGFGIPLKLVEPGAVARSLPAGAVAPELSAGQCDTLSDVYSLAATLHLLLTRHLWQPGVAEAESLAELRPDLPRPLVQAIMRGLAKQPMDRWPDVSTFRQAIVASLPGERGSATNWSPLAPEDALGEEPPTLVATREHLQAALAAEAAFHAEKQTGYVPPDLFEDDDDELTSTAPRPVVQVPAAEPAAAIANESPPPPQASVEPPAPDPVSAEPVVSTPASSIAWWMAPSPPRVPPIFVDGLPLEQDAGATAPEPAGVLQFRDVESLLASNPGVAPASAPAEPAPLPVTVSATPTPAPSRISLPWFDVPLEDPPTMSVLATPIHVAPPEMALPMPPVALPTAPEPPRPTPLAPLPTLGATGFVLVHHELEPEEAPAPQSVGEPLPTDVPAASTLAAIFDEPPPPPVLPTSRIILFPASEAPTAPVSAAPSPPAAPLPMVPPPAQPSPAAPRTVTPPPVAPPQQTFVARVEEPTEPMTPPRRSTSRPLDGSTTSRTPSRPLGAILSKLRNVLLTPQPPVRATGTIVLPRQMFPQHVYSILVRIQQWAPRDAVEARGDGLAIVEVECSDEAFYLPVKRLALQVPKEGALSEGTLTVTAKRPSAPGATDHLTFTFKTGYGAALHEDPFLADVTILPITHVVSGQPMLTLVHALDLP